jgi:hypothetical protein
LPIWLLFACINTAEVSMLILSSISTILTPIAYIFMSNYLNLQIVNNFSYSFIFLLSFLFLDLLVYFDIYFLLFLPPWTACCCYLLIYLKACFSDRFLLQECLQLLFVFLAQLFIIFIIWLFGSYSIKLEIGLLGYFDLRLSAITAILISHMDFIRSLVSFILIRFDSIRFDSQIRLVYLLTL